MHFKKLGSDKSYRYEHGEFLCDGEKLLKEALESNIQIITILTSKVLNFKLPKTVRMYFVKSDLINSLSPLKNSQGLLFTCKMSGSEAYTRFDDTCVLLDNIQDPGNIGTIIRTACAFDIPAVFLTDGCADIYNPKTIRATMGAIFKQKVRYLSQEDLIKLKNTNIKFHGASNIPTATNINEVDFKKSLIIIGNEGQGLSPNIESLCDDFMKIPISSNSESLNASAAAAILLWEASKKYNNH